MARHRKWSAATKFEIALLAIKGEMTLNEICKRYELSPTQVQLWKKQVLEQGEQIFNKNKTNMTSTLELERQQSKLYEKIGQLTVERDFLKKSFGKLPGNGGEN
jgi:transposase